MTFFDIDCSFCEVVIVKFFIFVSCESCFILFVVCNEREFFIYDMYVCDEREFFICLFCFYYLES